MSEKKLYIVSIHSHGGSFWEASGTHRIVEFTEKEFKAFAAKYQHKEIASERHVCITPITEILTSIEIQEVVTNYIREHEDEELEDEEA